MARKRERGFSLVAAIFVIVVLALLGAFMVTIGQVQRSTVTGALQGSRAYYAAKAGVELGVYNALNTPLGTTCGAAPASVQTGPLALSVPGLDGFTVTVVCSYTTHQEQGNTFQVFSISSTATYGIFGSPDYAARTIHTTATNSP
ncbi:MAG: pilus assembly protein MshP [Sulfurifustis sp.]